MRLFFYTLCFMVCTFSLASEETTHKQTKIHKLTWWLQHKLNLRASTSTRHLDATQASLHRRTYSDGAIFLQASPSAACSQKEKSLPVETRTLQRIESCGCTVLDALPANSRLLFGQNNIPEVPA